jgi:hypothetical protein
MASRRETCCIDNDIDEIALHLARGVLAVLLLDRSGWHTAGHLV